MSRVVTFSCVVALGLSLSAASLSAAEWGTLKGQFVYDGKAPAPAKLSITKDVETCGKHDLVDESLVVGANGGLANVVIYIVPPRGKKLDVHPDYASSSAEEVVLDNKGCRFEPHVALMRLSQPLVLKNSDPVGHNSNILAFVNPAANVLIPANGQVTQKMHQEERMPVRVSCNIHPWMNAYVVVRDDPYMAVSAADGTFEIKNIPVGEHEFFLWQEKIGYLKRLKVGKEKTNTKGRVDLKIAAGDNDLGKIEVK